jgi:hypothetical protein
MRAILLKEIFANKRILLIFLISIFFAMPVWAQDMELVSRELDRYSQEQQGSAVPSPEVRVSVKKTHSFEMGSETYDYKYVETDGGSEVMNYKGSYQGLFAAYTFRPADMDSFLKELALNIFRLEARYASGRVDYTGGYSDGFTITPMTYSGVKDYVYELRGLLGWEYDWIGGWQIGPYTGVGLRYLNNGGKAMPYGYDRESKYLYIPVGVTFHKDFRRGWRLGFNMEYDALVKGRQTSHLENLDPEVGAVNNAQRNGTGWRGSCKIEKDLPRLKLSVEPFYRYWNVKSSVFEPIISAGEPTGWWLYEPDNTTEEIGIKIGVGF